MALSGITDQITSDASPQCLSLASSCMQDGAGSMNEKLQQNVPHSTSVESPHDRYHAVAAELARRAWFGRFALRFSLPICSSRAAPISLASIRVRGCAVPPSVAAFARMGATRD